MKIAEPLPECVICERPVRREAHQRNGGLCSRCRGIYSGLHVVAEDGTTPTIFARGGYPPPLVEVEAGSDD